MSIPTTALVQYITENKPPSGLAEEHVQRLAGEVLRLRDFIRNQHLDFADAEDYDTFTGYLEKDAAEIASWGEDPNKVQEDLERERAKAEAGRKEERERAELARLKVQFGE